MLATYITDHFSTYIYSISLIKSYLSQSLSRFIKFPLVTNTEMSVEMVHHASAHVHEVGPGYIALKLTVPVSGGFTTPS